jgi:MoaA/NifB/PqqE/SkfB family radical SAM enzyme
MAVFKKVATKLVEMLLAYQPSLGRILPSYRSVIFYPTFFCNYSCKYCVVKKAGCIQKFPRNTEKPYHYWLEILNKFPPSKICISGGEPFCYNGLVDLINNLHQKHIVGISTNLSFPVDTILKLKKEVSIVASFHPQFAHMEPFLEKLKILKKNGFVISVNLVAYPPNFTIISNFIKILSHNSIGFTIDPDIDPTFKYSDDEFAQLKNYSIKHPKLGFDHNDIQLKQCLAGFRHFFISPNGDVYACHAGFYYVNSIIHNKYRAPRYTFYLGNLFEGSFKPVNTLKLCHYPCSEACDLYGAKPKLVSRQWSK